jgi:hypothetical protein
MYLIKLLAIMFYNMLMLVMPYIKQPPERCISGITSCNRRTSTMRTVAARHQRQEVHHGTIEMDSHADTIVFGKNFVQLQGTGRECTVSPFTDSYDAIRSVPIVQAATAWTNPSTGETYILVFNEGLWMAEYMDTSLINPNQLRHYGIVVQDNPYSKAPLYILSLEDDFMLPLRANGTNIIADTRTPTNQELQTCKHIVLSSPHYWDPQNVRYPEPKHTVEEEMRMHMEQAMVSGVGVKDHKRSDYDTEIPDNYQTDVSDDESESETILFGVDNFQRKLIKSVKVKEAPPISKIASINTDDDVAPRPTFQSTKRHTDVSTQDLSERWCISLKQAADTLKRTMQRIIRSAILPLGR